VIAPFVAGLLLTALAGEADAGSRRSRPLRTGQTTCWNQNGKAVDCAGRGHDGALQRGEARAYLDNGDGTITDQRTALRWEKLSDDDSIHDKDNDYEWVETWGRLAELNTPPCFAGFCDWRLPNRFELETLLDLGKINPAIADAFNTNCGANSSGNPGCTVLTCSCTIPYDYWSSTSYVQIPQFAWIVSFYQGSLFGDNKYFEKQVRAVRGGS